MAGKTRKAALAASPSTSQKGLTRKQLMGGVVFVIVAVVSFLIVRWLADPGKPVVDLARLQREQEVRRKSIDVVTRSEELIKNGQLDQAMRNIEQVTESDPHFYPAHLVLGYVFLRQGKLPLAEQATRKAHDLDPNEPAINYQLGQIEMGLGKLDSAIELLGRAIRVQKEREEPTEPRYHVTLAEALLRNGQKAMAADQLKLALSVDRKETIASASMAGGQSMTALGRLLADRREFDAAVKLLADAAEQNPDQPDAQYQVARLYYIQNQAARAVPYIDRAVTLDPSNEDYVHLRRQIHESRGGSTTRASNLPALLEQNEPEQDTTIFDVLKR